MLTASLIVNFILAAILFKVIQEALDLHWLCEKRSKYIDTLLRAVKRCTEYRRDMRNALREIAAGPMTPETRVAVERVIGPVIDGSQTHETHT